MEKSSTRAGRPRRVVDLVAVLKERSSMTSTAPRAQSIVEHYGVLPAVPVVDDVYVFSFERPSGG